MLSEWNAGENEENRLIASPNSIAAWNVTARGLTKTRHEGSKVLYVVTATKVDVEQWLDDFIPLVTIVRSTAQAKRVIDYLTQWKLVK